MPQSSAPSDAPTTHSCVECAGETARNIREMLSGIDEAVREGLAAWPRTMDRVEFVRECVKLHREAASSAPRSGLSTDEAEKLIGAFERAVVDAADTVPHDEYTRKLHAAVPVARAALLRALTGETMETR